MARSHTTVEARWFEPRIALEEQAAGELALAFPTVKQLESCPATRAAVTAGDVSLAQAAEITSVPEHETELLELARESGLRAVKDTARRRRVEGIDPEELYARQHEAREFVHWKDERWVRV